MRKGPRSEKARGVLFFLLRGAIFWEGGVYLGGYSLLFLTKDSNYGAIEWVLFWVLSGSFLGPLFFIRGPFHIRLALESLAAREASAPIFNLLLDDLTSGDHVGKKCYQ